MPTYIYTLLPFYFSLTFPLALENPTNATMRNQKQLIGLENTKELWLPNSLLVEILCRLSSKTLARLRLVSKEWKCIISDRSFITLQLKHKEKLAGFFFQGRYNWSDDDVKIANNIDVGRDCTKVQKDVLVFLPEEVVIMSSRDGLVCCRSSFPCPHPVIYVCNPLNREWVTIQWHNPPKKSSTVLIFEPFRDRIDVSTDFQLVTVCQTVTHKGDEEEFQFSFKIYSSRTKEWTEPREVCTCRHKLQKKGCVFVEGTIYWLTEDNHILMFVPENQMSCLIMGPFPTCVFNFEPGLCLGEADGRLQYVLISQDGLHVWELLDKFASQWELKHCIPPVELEKENPRCMYQISKKLTSHLTTKSSFWISPLCFKDTTMLLRIATEIYAFEFDTRKAKWLCPLSVLGPNSWTSPIVIPYTMSLVPLD